MTFSFQAYDWAVESMKFVSGMNMDDCLTEEGVERLSNSLTSFIKEHKIIDKRVFDDVAVKARNLGNKKLMEQCRIARSRCEETKQVLKVRETTIVRAREEIEAQRARKISLDQLAAETNITPLTSPAKCVKTPSASHEDEDIWLPQSPSQEQTTTANSSIRKSKSHSKSDDSNNNVTKKLSASKNPSQSSIPRTNSEGAQLGSAADSSNNLLDVPKPKLTESLDTMASSSQEDILSSEGAGSQSDIIGDTNSTNGSNTHVVSPIMSESRKESSAVKRRSFAGFTASPTSSQQNFPSNNLSKYSSKKNAVEDSVKRLSDSPSTDISEHDEGLASNHGDDNSSTNSHAELSKSVVEKLEELEIIDTSVGHQDGRKVHARSKEHSFRDSVITGSSGSLTRLVI